MNWADSIPNPNMVPPNMIPPSSDPRSKLIFEIGSLCQYMWKNWNSLPNEIKPPAVVTRLLIELLQPTVNSSENPSFSTPLELRIKTHAISTIIKRSWSDSLPTFISQLITWSYSQGLSGDATNLLKLLDAPSSVKSPPPHYITSLSLHFILALATEFDIKASSRLYVPIQFHQDARDSFEANWLLHLFQSTFSVLSKLHTDQSLLTMAFQILDTILSWNFCAMRSQSSINQIDETHQLLQFSKSGTSGTSSQDSSLPFADRKWIEPGQSWYFLTTPNFVNSLFSSVKMARIDPDTWASALRVVLRVCCLHGSVFQNTDSPSSFRVNFDSFYRLIWVNILKYLDSHLSAVHNFIYSFDPNFDQKSIRLLAVERNFFSLFISKLTIDESFLNLSNELASSIVDKIITFGTICLSTMVPPTMTPLYAKTWNMSSPAVLKQSMQALSILHSGLFRENLYAIESLFCGAIANIVSSLDLFCATKMLEIFRFTSQELENTHPQLDKRFFSATQKAFILGRAHRQGFENVAIYNLLASKAPFLFGHYLFCRSQCPIWQEHEGPHILGDQTTAVGLLGRLNLGASLAILSDLLKSSHSPQHYYWTLRMATCLLTDHSIHEQTKIPPLVLTWCYIKDFTTATQNTNSLQEAMSSFTLFYQNLTKSSASPNHFNPVVSFIYSILNSNLCQFHSQSVSSPLSALISRFYAHIFSHYICVRPSDYYQGTLPISLYIPLSVPIDSFYSNSNSSKILTWLSDPLGKSPVKAGCLSDFGPLSPKEFLLNSSNIILDWILRELGYLLKTFSSIPPVGHADSLKNLPSQFRLFELFNFIESVRLCQNSRRLVSESQVIGLILLFLEYLILHVEQVPVQWINLCLFTITELANFSIPWMSVQANIPRSLFEDDEDESSSSPEFFSRYSPFETAQSSPSNKNSFIPDKKLQNSRLEKISSLFSSLSPNSLPSFAAGIALISGLIRPYSKVKPPRQVSNVVSNLFFSLLETIYSSITTLPLTGFSSNIPVSGGRGLTPGSNISSPRQSNFDQVDHIFADPGNTTYLYSLRRKCFNPEPNLISQILSVITEFVRVHLSSSSPGQIDSFISKTHKILSVITAAVLKAENPEDSFLDIISLSQLLLEFDFPDLELLSVGVGAGISDSNSNNQIISDEEWIKTTKFRVFNLVTSNVYSPLCSFFARDPPNKTTDIGMTICNYYPALAEQFFPLLKTGIRIYSTEMAALPPNVFSDMFSSITNAIQSVIPPVVISAFSCLTHLMVWHWVQWSQFTAMFENNSQGRPGGAWDNIQRKRLERLLNLSTGKPKQPIGLAAQTGMNIGMLTQIISIIFKCLILGHFPGDLFVPASHALYGLFVFAISVEADSSLVKKCLFQAVESSGSGSGIGNNLGILADRVHALVTKYCGPGIHTSFTGFLGNQKMNTDTEYFGRMARRRAEFSRELVTLVTFARSFFVDK